MADNPISNSANIVGGGPKKVLYTLRTLNRIGLKQSGKALKSNNACKACGLGMGGQRGGMVNELGEFPSVCNKSIQAQSTDIQAAIPDELFSHTLNNFQQLSDRELEHLGRLNTPIYKAADTDRYQPLSWEDAFSLAAERFAATDPERSFFYSSGRSSNEAGFTLQLLARLYGTNNINNCSFYCHQATGVGLKATIGTGTATVKLEDLQHADLVFVIGANPSSNHPRMLHQLKQCRDRGGQVIMINPAKEPGLVRFAVPKSAKSMMTGGTWIASEYVQPRINGDTALLNGIAKSLLESGHIDQAFIHKHTQDFDQYTSFIRQLPWKDVILSSGVEKKDIDSLAKHYACSEHTIFCWGMGITHHLNGVENVEAIVNLALLRGQIGKTGAGLLPLRGHSNVQGIGTVGVKPLLEEDVFKHIESYLGVTLPRTQGKDTLASLQAADHGEIDAALIMGGNLYSATPDSRWARQALDRIGFKVFLTTTLNRGHITGMESSESLVLPVTARDEEWQPTTQESMFNYVRLSDGGIKRLDGVLPESRILCEIAQRLLPDSPVNFDDFKEHSTIRASIAASIPGLEELADIDKTLQEFTVKGRVIHDNQFPTESGKAHFRVTPIPSMLASKEYPFLLASIRSEGQFNSIIYEEEDTYRGTKTRWCLLMSQQDMSMMHLQAGDSADVTSPHGKMQGLTLIDFDVAPGNVLAYYPEANTLIGTHADPRSKTPAFKSVPVAIRKSSSDI